MPTCNSYWPLDDYLSQNIPSQQGQPKDLQPQQRYNLGRRRYISE